MHCPWYDVTAGPRALHAHLGERHGDQVRTGGLVAWCEQPGPLPPEPARPEHQRTGG